MELSGVKSDLTPFSRLAVWGLLKRLDYAIIIPDRPIFIWQFLFSNRASDFNLSQSHHPPRLLFSISFPSRSCHFGLKLTLIDSYNEPPKFFPHHPNDLGLKLDQNSKLHSITRNTYIHPKIFKFQVYVCIYTCWFPTFRHQIITLYFPWKFIPAVPNSDHNSVENSPMNPDSPESLVLISSKILISKDFQKSETVYKPNLNPKNSQWAP